MTQRSWFISLNNSKANIIFIEINKTTKEEINGKKEKRTEKQIEEEILQKSYPIYTNRLIGKYSTDSTQKLPPFSSSNFLVTESINSSPRFIRSTLYLIPRTKQILDEIKIPFTILVEPFAKIKKNKYEKEIKILILETTVQYVVPDAEDISRPLQSLSTKDMNGNVQFVI
ncbi:secretory 24cd isoform c [Anaeramoeba ignava]|uniref:Secretory 24cd isoform c n=1 Tax=Anaeramoeba ignava TaxID=1746090 RepID=A0A9Q0LI60_ANAIG|nr:secretory 24cd isoform c [Anaeramoeba ignava]